MTLKSHSTHCFFQSDHFSISSVNFLAQSILHQPTKCLNSNPQARSIATIHHVSVAWQLGPESWGIEAQYGWACRFIPSTSGLVSISIGLINKPMATSARIRTLDLQFGTRTPFHYATTSWPFLRVSKFLLPKMLPIVSYLLIMTIYVFSNTRGAVQLPYLGPAQSKHQENTLKRRWIALSVVFGRQPCLVGVNGVHARLHSTAYGEHTHTHTIAGRIIALGKNYACSARMENRL